jgi:hypothetical protein
VIEKERGKFQELEKPEIQTEGVQDRNIVEDVKK